MRSFWTEPFLWIHLAGIAALPLALELVWLGLAVGDPILPVWLELLLVAAVGIVPVLWMQLTRPFDIFSILVLAMKPEQLTQEQRRLLSLFKTKNNPASQLLLLSSCCGYCGKSTESLQWRQRLLPLHRDGALLGCYGRE
jgi:hypothetical protein